MKEYEIIEIMGNFETLVGSIVTADDSKEAKDMIIEDIKNNIDKYLYPVIEEKGE